MTTPRPTFSSPEIIKYNLKCENGATYTQLCTDRNFNITQCNNLTDSNGISNQYRYNTIFCNCNNQSNMYDSKAVQKDNGLPMPTYN
jgi:hypothetical protein